MAGVCYLFCQYIYRDRVVQSIVVEVRCTSRGLQAVCSAVLLRLFLFQCGLRGPLPELRLPALQTLDFRSTS